ncbi:molybdopterin-dependent oxidoreductase [Streptosporangiaceae bacterium NEAU-GS5]|nr:molybdopterin-dependent oxidoreductase [Streptosporangiaceae bacterium NEAU-GS5]
MNSKLPRWAAALYGVVAAAIALGVAQLIGAVTSVQASPVIAVGGAFVDRTPPWLKEFAIRTFGQNDKLALIVGIVAVVAVIAAAMGLLSRYRLGYGLAGFAAFGVVGAIAAMTRPDAGQFDILPSLVGAAAGAWGLSLLFRDTSVPGYDADGRVLASVRTKEQGEGVAEPERPPIMRAGQELGYVDRRMVLARAGIGIGVAGVGALIGGVIGSRRDVEAARTGVARTLPRPAVAAKPIPAGADLRIKGLSPFVTPARDFYRVDTALAIPAVSPDDWILKIHGMVDRPIQLTFADLLKRPLIEADVTLTCVSNDVGGPYIGNARWLGARLADVLREAGLQKDADMLLSVSQDGFTCGTPVDIVMDGRDALLAVAMNGEVLPAAHGFPVRQVVPGLYGYVSATKWVTEIKVTRFDRDEAYWTPRGWSAQGPIKTESRIDVPKGADSVPAGRTTIAGVAWAQHKGVEAVEVRVDIEPWRQARLADVPGPDTWRQWSIEWDLPRGDHEIQVRATDVTGYTQTPEVAPPAPDGASGYHTISVHVT